jgi:hypothetical protein
MNKKIIILLLLSISIHTARADFISLIRADQCESIMEIFILENGIRITFEIGEKDYPYFKRIVPETFYQGGFTDAAMEKSFDEFLGKDFTIHADGRLLKGTIDKIMRLKRNYRITGRPYIPVRSIPPTYRLVRLSYMLRLITHYLISLKRLQ